MKFVLARVGAGTRLNGDETNEKHAKRSLSTEVYYCVSECLFSFRAVRRVLQREMKHVC